MIRKLVLSTATVALVAPLSVALAAPASAAPNPRGACVQAGLGTLKGADLLQAAAQQQVDYSALVAGLPTPTYLSLGTVVKLHTTNPELFTWCAQ